MRALTLPHPGGPSAPTVADAPMPTPTHGEVRVRVAACGLNPVDVSLSHRGHPDWTYPHILGLDVAGTIDAIGEGVTGWSVGDRVAYHGDLRKSGGLAQYAVTEAYALARIPDSVPFVDAAALPCAGMTAWQAIDRLRLGAGDTILVTAGNGGVGGFAIQLAALRGARVVTTASSDAQRLHRLGATTVVDYTRKDVGDALRAASTDGFDGIVDTVGSANATGLLEHLAFAGGIACIAGRPDLAALPPFGGAPSIHLIALGAAHAAGTAKDKVALSSMLDGLLSLVTERRLDPMVTATCDLDGASGALAEIEGRHVHGKLVVTLHG